MLSQNYIEELTGLKDILVTKVKNVYGEQHIYATMKQRIHSCPSCGHLTSKVHDYREQMIKDIPSFGQKSYLHLRKRRHSCPQCGKRFQETIDFLPKYHRMTNRLYAYLLNELAETQSMKKVGRMVNISGFTVARIFHHVQHPKPTLPHTLSIDEFRGNAGGEKFQCVLTNPAQKRVLDILPNRKVETLYEYFSSFQNRKEVRFVVMDMSSLFRGVVRRCFPQAKIVADRFHVVRQVCWALEQVRQEEQKKFHPSRRKYFKRSRTLLLKHQEKLKDAQKEQLLVMLRLAPRLARAYYVLQDFYQLMKSPSRREAKKHLGAWMMRVQSYNLPEFDACTKAISHWSKEILNSFECGLTNGYTEGVNNKIKVLKRVSYGLKDFHLLRNRILHIMAT